MPTTTATAQDICIRAMKMAGLAGTGQTLDGSDVQDVFDILNGMLDAWSMDGLYVFGEQILDFALVSGQQVTPIGPSAAAPFNVPRPNKIQNANLVINTPSPAVRIPLNLTDYDGWMSISVLAIPPTYPTVLYYEQSYPNGNLHLWPPPQGGLMLELAVWAIIAQFAAITDRFSFPPGYYEAIYQNLTLRLCTPEYGILQVPPSVIALANESRSRIQQLNTNPPPIMRPDPGMQSVRGQSGWRNIYDPQIWYRGGTGSN